MKDGTFEIYPSDVRVESSHITVSGYLEDRHKTFTKAAQSETIFDSMEDDEVDVLALTVANALEYLADSVHEWIRDGLSLSEPGDKLTVSVDILVSDIEDYGDFRQFISKERIRELNEAIDSYDSESDG